MIIKSTFSGGTLRLYLSGELDHHAARASMDEIESAILFHLPVRCIVEMGGVTFMDSSGIAVLLKLHRRISAFGGEITVICPGTQPRKVIDAAGLDRFMSVIPKKGDAK